MARSGPVAATAAGLSYPERFHAAAAYAGFSSHDSVKGIAPRFPNDTSLVLYALYQQATVGKCNTAKPWGWNTVELAKWSSWNQLDSMSSIEAMRLFVRTLEEEDPDWFSKYLEQEVIISNSITSSRSTTEIVVAASGTSQTMKEPGNAEVLELTSNGGYISVNAESPSDLSENGEYVPNEVSMITKERDAVGGHALEAVTTYNEWISPSVTGRIPPARYQHAAAIVEDKMFVVGGNHNGRYLNDVQVLDLRTLTWSKVEQKLGQGASLPPCAGHNLIRWGRSLLLVAGHSKASSDTVRVHAFDTETSMWSLLPSYGQAPAARGGQSVSLVGSSLVMFGGEDSRRRLLNDLNIFDLETMTWDAVEPVGTPPSPRSDHAAAVFDDHYLFIFGGGSHSTCFGDLHVLDLKSMEWSQPSPFGVLPPPRAGHAGVVIGDNWYIVGGGDNKAGISEMLVVNLGTLEWSVAASVPARTSIASEGLSVLTTTVNGEEAIVAFGGYNGHYSNEVHIFKTRFKLRKESKFVEAMVNDGSASSAVSDFVVLPQPSTVYKVSTDEVTDCENPLPEANDNHSASEEKLSTTLEANKELEKAAAEAQGEIIRLKQELAAALSTSSDLAKELQSVRGQLVAEQSRCFRLEVDVAELRQKLQSLEVLQKELDLLRRQKAASDEVVAQAASERQNAGVWGWLAGAPPDQKSIDS
ncbi:hypothetical protein O6H91_04G131700 [Diphasiastrum complanatum]|uniref:Uncharacterized protein n=1 Tax=Diphasiastrum complanatum TaxID=34168 RepID=A0ACC2E1Z9_DIPCM|nr:hypothetical protein O6H91_04G131700 [Diphasiastrum complanatum]